MEIFEFWSFLRAEEEEEKLGKAYVFKWKRFLFNFWCDCCFCLLSTWTYFIVLKLKYHVIIIGPLCTPFSLFFGLVLSNTIAMNFFLITQTKYCVLKARKMCALVFWTMSTVCCQCLGRNGEHFSVLKSIVQVTRYLGQPFRVSHKCEMYQTRWQKSMKVCKLIGNGLVSNERKTF